MLDMDPMGSRHPRAKQLNVPRYYTATRHDFLRVYLKRRATAWRRYWQAGTERLGSCRIPNNNFNKNPGCLGYEGHYTKPIK